MKEKESDSWGMEKEIEGEKESKKKRVEGKEILHKRNNKDCLRHLNLEKGYPFECNRRERRFEGHSLYCTKSRIIC